MPGLPGTKPEYGPWLFGPESGTRRPSVVVTKSTAETFSGGQSARKGCSVRT